MSSQRVNIQFPVRKHVQKYLLASAGEQLIVSKNSFIGSVLLDILSRSGRDTAKCPGEVFYPILISVDYMERYGANVSDVTKNKFNNYIDKLMRLELLAYIKLSRNKKNIHECVRNFLDLYNITEDEIKFETLIKYVHRNLN